MIYISFQQWCVSCCFFLNVFWMSFISAILFSRKKNTETTDWQQPTKTSNMFWQEKWPFFDAVVNAVPKDAQVNL